MEIQEWRQTSPEELPRLIPEGATLWIKTDTSEREEFPPSCHAVLNIVGCRGACPANQQCKPDPNGWVNCMCQ